MGIIDQNGIHPAIFGVKQPVLHNILSPMSTPPTSGTKENVSSPFTQKVEGLCMGWTNSTKRKPILQIQRNHRRSKIPDYVSNAIVHVETGGNTKMQVKVF